MMSQHPCALSRAVLQGGVALVVTLSAMAAAAPAAAQQERPARWSLAARTDVVQSGGATELVLAAAVDEGWYLYALSQPAGGPQPLVIEVAGTGFRLAGAIGAPRPRTYADRTFDLFTAIHRGDVSFTLPVAVEGANGRREVAALVTYQMCNSTYCLPPRTDTVSTVVTVTGGIAGTAGPAALRADWSAAAAPESALATASDPGSIAPAFAPATAYTDSAAEVTSVPAVPASRAGPASLLAGPAAPLAFGQAAAAGPDGAAAVAGFLWLAILMGVLSLLTPCVFPMVPITVAYFGARESAAAGVRVRSAALYGAGIIGTFTAAGVFTSVVFGAGGVILLAANPWMNLAIAALFVLFALNLMGRLELRLPTRLISRAAQGGGSGGTGAFLMGGAFAVTSFTCTAPFVGTLLVLATQGSWRWPLLGLFAYASAFALPFVFLALAPGALTRLPRPGAWMRDIRMAVGILELAIAAKFISNVDLVWGWNVLTRDAVIIVWLVALALIVLLLLARRPAVFPRIAAATVTVMAALWLARGLDGHRLGELEAFLPPAAHGAFGVGAGELPWRLNDLDGSLAAAAAEGRPVLLDFTGYTCINCRWMEANMFPRRDVSALLDGFVRVRLYTDGKGAVYQQQQALQERMFGTVALPYYAILTPDGTPVSTFLGMTRRERDFIAFLRTGLDAH
jgi:thiol:disulfide interchange protein